MTVTETAVTNAANLSLFMVNLSHLLLRDFRQEIPRFGVLDLKAHFRGRKYVAETIKQILELTISAASSGVLSQFTLRERIC
jgi:hypothetical protein